MSSRFNLDHEAFQNLLANAFVVQESGVDVHSLSAVIKLQRIIGSGAVDEQAAMNLVADRARDVANAAGIAVALLNGDELVYRAGSGTAGPYVGRRVTAILSVSQNREAGAEILRVENSDTDTRIEAAICREFGAKSLLILPIYREGRVAGAEMVLFSEPHIFLERELRAYRLMAGLLGDAISRNVQGRATSGIPAQATGSIPALNLSARREVVEPPPVRTVVKAAQAMAPAYSLNQPSSQPSLSERRDSVSEKQSVQPKPQAPTGWVIEKRRSRKTAWVDGLSVWGSAAAAKATKAGSSLAASATDAGRSLYARRKSILGMFAVWNDQRKTALVIAALLVVASWFAFRNRGPVTSLESGSGIQTPASIQAPASVQQAPTSDVRLVSASTSTTTPLGAGDVKKPSARKVKGRTGDVVYLSDDVTVRYFKPKSAPKAEKTAQDQVHRISDDVTVRYFTPKQDADAKSSATGNAPKTVTR
jgi:hypothetical protein